MPKVLMEHERFWEIMNLQTCQMNLFLIEQLPWLKFWGQTTATNGYNKK